MNPPLVEDKGELENISGVESSHAQNHTKPGKDQRSKSKYQAIILIIIITRPKPAYGRQGLAGLWGQDTDQAGTFWGVVNISLRAFSAQLG